MDDHSREKTILVIDDSGAVLRNMKGWLEDSYRVIPANSGEIGLKYLATNRPDLVLLDIMMPGMDGFETYKKLRLMTNGRDLPVVFLTGSEDVDKELAALEMGATDFIRKPLHPQVMQNRIRRILELEDYHHHIESVILDQRIQLENLTLEAITTIAATIDAKDSYTKGHSERVADYAVKLGRAYGLTSPECDNLHTLGLLHDIGKIGIPDAVLLKAARLDDDEFAVMKTHTTIGAEILKTITSIPHISEGAGYHHERYDGSGYPEGLKGEEIPLPARIIAVADAYDAMTTNRIYRKMLDRETVISELEKGRGSQFDPKLADLMLDLLKKDML